MFYENYLGQLSDIKWLTDTKRRQTGPTRSSDKKARLQRHTALNQFLRTVNTVHERSQGSPQTRWRPDPLRTYMINDFTEQWAAESSLHPSPGCMLVSPLQAEKPRGPDERGFFGGECCIISGMDRMSWVRKGGGSRGVNMKTGPYGEKGVWSNGRSVSALQRRGETEQQKTGLVELKNTMKMVWG